MRISDWSSDVCSSDLPHRGLGYPLSLPGKGRGRPMIKPLRAWADKYRRRGKYTPVGVTFHWVMALLVLYQLYSGWTMQRYLVGADKLAAYKVPSEIGLEMRLSSDDGRVGKEVLSTGILRRG